MLGNAVWFGFRMKWQLESRDRRKLRLLLIYRGTYIYRDGLIAHQILGAHIFYLVEICVSVVNNDVKCKLEMVLL